MCCDGWQYEEEDINGECEFCGTLTVDGEAFEGCFYSPVTCKECGARPCDMSC